MQVYFKFDKDEFRNMFKHYAYNVLLDQVIDDYYSSNPEERRPEGAFDHELWVSEHEAFFNEWVDLNDSRYYPGETPSNVLTDKETMFSIGNGEFVQGLLRGFFVPVFHLFCLPWFFMGTQNARPPLNGGRAKRKDPQRPTLPAEKQI